MRRKGAGRDLPEQEKDLLGRYMDDYFGPREDDHAAEDAYENAWLARSGIEHEKLDTGATLKKLTNDPIKPFTFFW